MWMIGQNAEAHYDSFLSAVIFPDFFMGKRFMSSILFKIVIIR